MQVGSSEVAKIVRELGGKFSRNFSSGTTHLIAEVAASEKHRAAIRTMKQVVSREWIEKCWTTGRRAEEKEFPAKPLAGSLSMILLLSGGFRYRTQNTQALR